jgi:site-specific DNA-methyltransferase (adenine-specific)
MELINQFYHGDCCDVLKAVPDETVDFILTDPPYLTDYTARDGRKIKGDKSGDWLAPAFQEMHRVLKENHFCISFYGWAKVDVFFRAWKKAGFRPVGHLVFIKQYNSANKKTILRFHHEQAYLLVKGKPYDTNFPVTDVLSFTYTGNHLHPCEKSLQPLRRLIGAFTQVGDLVLDPLAGSGSTLLAAWQMERNYLGIELDPDYYAITRQRLEKEIIRGQRGIIEHCLMQETVM